MQQQQENIQQENTISIDNLIFTPYIQHNIILDNVFNIASAINLDYKYRNPVIIGVLNGSFMFMSDLCKNINIKCNITFIKVSSYEGLSSTNDIKESIGLSIDIKDRDVIIVEDIVDTGNTITHLIEMLNKESPQSIQTATLFFKPEAFKGLISNKPEYVGFNIENQFIIGYGLDYNGYYRNLKDVYIKV